MALNSRRKHELRVSNSTAEQTEAFRQYLEELIEVQSAQNRLIIVGFSGGSMPAFLGPILASLPDQCISRLRLFPVDERLVPLDSEESNAGALLRQLPGNKFGDKIIALKAGADQLEGRLVAQQFEQQLRELNPRTDLSGGWPIFDLLLLGLGPDGHTCSLFPGHPLVKDSSPAWILHIDDSPKPPPRRITVSLSLLNSAANLAFITNGASKAGVIKKIVEDNDQQFPPSQIQPKRPIQWFLDAEAAKEIANDAKNKLG